MVRGLKIALPTVALVLLVAMFVMAKQIPELSEIPYASPTLQERSKDQHVSEPHYMGLTQQGDLLNVFAQTITPLNENLSQILVVQPISRVKTKEGRSINLISNSGIVYSDGETMSMEGNVQIETSDGYRLTGSKINVNFNETLMVLNGPVTGVAPSGTLEAGSLTIRRSEESDALKFNFKGRVKVVYNRKQ